MSLAFFSILFNLVVLISIRERESLLNSTVNVVLANLCTANLVSAVFVKSIAVVYNGYAVARHAHVMLHPETFFLLILTLSFLDALVNEYYIMLQSCAPATKSCCKEASTILKLQKNSANFVIPFLPTYNVAVTDG